MAATPDERNGYAARPCRAELVAIVLAGLLHVVIELGLSEPVAWLYNGAVSFAFVGYVVWRVRRSSGVLRAWGMRRDNFWPALGAQLAFGAVGALALVAFGMAMGSLALPGTFWVTLLLYPAWGTTQQFALQNLIARNLAGLLSKPLAVALVASTLFSVSHFPRLELVVLTFVAGVFFTLIHRRFPNLWAVGIVHGILGSLAVYIVLGEDPGAAILDFLLNR